MDPLNYNAVRDEYLQFKVAKPESPLSLSEFAQLQDMQSGSPLRQVAYNDNVLKQANAGIDRFFAPVGDVIAPAGAVIDDLARVVVPSYEGRAGEEALRATPRTLAEFAGYMVPGAGQAAAIPRALSMGAKVLGAADAGLKGYSETDSPLAGAISAAALPLTNVGMGLGEQAAAKYLTRGAAQATEAAIKSGGAIPTQIVSPAKDALASFIGGNVGAGVVQEGARQATGIVTGQGITNPFTTENIVGQVAGLAPFLPKNIMDARAGHLNPAASAERAKITNLAETELRNRDNNKIIAESVGQREREATQTSRSMAEYIAGRTSEPQPYVDQFAKDFDYGSPALGKTTDELVTQAPRIAEAFEAATKAPEVPVLVGDMEADATKLSQMRPEDVNTVEGLTNFIKNVNSVLKANYDESFVKAEPFFDDGKGPKQVKDVINPEAVKGLQAEGRVPAITPEWLRENFNFHLDRSLPGTAEDAYAHMVQTVANRMATLAEDAKTKKGIELQNATAVPEKPSTDIVMDGDYRKAVETLTPEQQKVLAAQELEARKVTLYQGKTPQTKWPMLRDVVTQAVDNYDPATGMTKVEINQGKKGNKVTLELTLDQAIRGVRPTAEGEVSFIRGRAEKVSEGGRTNNKEQSLDAMGEEFTAKQREQQGGKLEATDEEVLKGNLVRDAAYETKDNLSGIEEGDLDAPDSPLESLSTIDNDGSAQQDARELLRNEVQNISGPESSKHWNKYSDLWSTRMKDKAKELLGPALQARLKGDPALKREVAARYFNKPVEQITPKQAFDANTAIWGEKDLIWNKFVGRVAETLNIKPDAMGQFDQLNNVMVAREGSLPPLRVGLQDALTRHGRSLGFGPEMQKHFVETGLKFVDAFKGLEQYRFSDLNIQDPLSGERFAQKVSEGLQAAGLHGQAYLTPDGKVVRNPFLSIAVEHAAKNKDDTPFYNWLTLSTIGHEAIHSIDANLARYEMSSDPDLRQMAASYKSMFAEASALTPQERFLMLKSVAQTLIPDKYRVGQDGALRSDLRGYLAHGAVDPKEFIPVYGQMFLSGMITKGEKLDINSAREALRYESLAGQDFVRGVYRQIADFSEPLKAITQANPAMARAFDRVHAELPKLVKQDPVIAKANADLVQTTAVLSPGAVTTLANGAPLMRAPDETQVQAMKMLGVDWDKSKDGVREGLSEAGDFMHGGQKNLNFWTRNFMPFVQAMARTGQKSAQDAASTLLDSNRGRTNVANQMLAPTMMRTEYGKMVANKEHPLRKLMEGGSSAKPTVTHSVFNELMDNLQGVGDAGKLNTKVTPGKDGRIADAYSQLRTLNPELDKTTGAALAKLSPENRGQVLAALDAALEVTNIGGTIMLKSQQDHMGARIGRVMQTINRDMPYDQALDRGRLLMQGVNLKDKSIVMKAVDGLDPKTATAMIELGQSLNEPVLALQKMIEDRPFFMTEQRQGQYMVVSTKDGKRYVDGADNRGHAENLAEKMTKMGHTDIQTFDKYARYGEFVGDMPMRYADQFANIEQQAYANSLKNIEARFGKDVAEQLQNDFTPLKEVTKAFAAKGVNALLQERKRVPSALGMDYIRNLDGYIQGMSVSTSNRAVRDRISAILADKSMDLAPDAKPMIETQMANTLRRGDETTAQLKTILTGYYLAGNLSSMFVEGAQTLSSLVPALIANGHTVKGAYGALGSAMQKAVGFRLKANELNRLADTYGSAPKNKEAEQAYYFRRWVNEAPDAGSHIEDRNITADQSSLIAGRNRHGNFEDLPVTTIARNGLYQLSQKALKAYATFSEFNNRAAFLAAFDQAQGKGLSGEAAYTAAQQTVYGSMFGGGRANSANYIAKASVSPYMRPVVAMTSALQSYSLGMTSLLGTLGHDAILGDKTLNPAQRLQAKKAFGVALGTQLALSGALGLPFAAASLAVVEKLTGIQANSLVRQGLASLAGDDEELGSTFADVALNGGANQLLGIDVGGRLGLSSVLGTSAYSGFNFKDLLGPAPSVFENLGNATLAASQGNVGQAVTSLVPQAFKHAAQMVDSQSKFGEVRIMDKSNNLIMKPSQTEAALYAIGFNPKRLRDYKNEQNLMTMADKNAAALHDRDLDQLAVGLIGGDKASLLAYIQQQKKDNPTIDPQSLVRSVVDRVIAMQQPKDLMQGGLPGSWQDRQDIRRTFSGDINTRQTELQKLLAREQLFAGLGYPAGLRPAGPSEYARSAMLDQLTASGAGRGEASAELAARTRMFGSNPR